MFRFSIRELFLITVVVALVVGWSVEHRRANAASAETKRVAEKAEIEEWWRELALKKINGDLFSHDLKIVWAAPDEDGVKQLSLEHVTGQTWGRSSASPSLEALSDRP